MDPQFDCDLIAKNQQEELQALRARVEELERELKGANAFWGEKSDADYTLLCKQAEEIATYRDLKAKLNALEPVAWMSPGKERLEFSRPDTVYGSHTIPLVKLTDLEN